MRANERTLADQRNNENIFVAVGYHNSNKTNSHLGWRISYTLWERKFILSLRDVQLHCHYFEIDVKLQLKQDI